MSMVEMMVGLAISGIVVAAVMDVIAEISIVNTRQQIENTVNQTYYEGVQTALNATLYTDRNPTNPDPLHMSANLKACLSNKPASGFDCTSLDTTKATAAEVPAQVSPTLNTSVGLNGTCTGPACVVQRKATYSWVCPNAKFCSGLRVEIASSPVSAQQQGSAGEGRETASSGLGKALSWKERRGSVFIPARQLMSKGEITFQCARAGNFALFRLDYVNLTDLNGCSTFDPGAPCDNPMNLYGGNNCLGAQTLACNDGFSTSGLYGTQAGCIPATGAVTPGPTGGPTGPTTPTPIDGACGPADGTTVTTAPTAGLCSTGTASAVAGGGPWTWTCAGQNGGENKPCSALKTAATSGRWALLGISAFGPSGSCINQNPAYFPTNGPCSPAGAECFSMMTSWGGARGLQGYYIWRCQ